MVQDSTIIYYLYGLQRLKIKTGKKTGFDKDALPERIKYINKCVTQGSWRRVNEMLFTYTKIKQTFKDTLTNRNLKIENWHMCPLGIKDLWVNSSHQPDVKQGKDPSFYSMVTVIYFWYHYLEKPLTTVPTTEVPKGWIVFTWTHVFEPLACWRLIFPQNFLLYALLFCDSTVFILQWGVF